MGEKCEHKFEYKGKGPFGEGYRFCELCGLAEAVVPQYVDHIVMRVEVGSSSEGESEEWGEGKRDL